MLKIFAIILCGLVFPPFALAQSQYIERGALAIIRFQLDKTFDSASGNYIGSHNAGNSQPADIASTQIHYRYQVGPTQVLENLGAFCTISVRRTGIVSPDAMIYVSCDPALMPTELATQMGNPNGTFVLSYGFID